MVIVSWKSSILSFDCFILCQIIFFICFHYHFNCYSSYLQIISFLPLILRKCQLIITLFNLSKLAIIFNQFYKFDTKMINIEENTNQYKRLIFGEVCMIWMISLLFSKIIRVMIIRAGKIE